MFNRQLCPRAENDYEELFVFNLMPANLKATIELQGTIVYACLERLEGIAVGTFLRPRLTSGGSFLLSRQLPVLYFSLRRTFAGLGDDYLHFTRHNTLPPLPIFLGNLDFTDPFFVITRDDIEADPNLFREQAVVHHQNADESPPPRHRLQVIALKNDLVAFLREVIGDLCQQLLNPAVILGNEEEIFDAANRILRCLPLIANVLNRTIEQEAAINRRRARAN
ncbi:hypothetical protein TYRP_018292 [Tyrophagus putrescentiae]|nr:hypothetical protein TYRP_018292 [Tyrophagus putrescentiae]